MKLLAVALVVASTLSGALLTSDAGASSVYDNVYKTTDSLISCRGVDYTIDDIFFDIFNDGPILSVYSNVGLTKSELADEMRSVQLSPTGAWFASKYTTNFNSSEFFFGYSNTGYILNWQSDYVSLETTDYNAFSLECPNNPSYPFRIVRWFGNSTLFPPNIVQGNEHVRVLDNYYVSGNVDYNYPTGYEGEEISDSLPAPVETSNYTPDISIFHGKNFKVDFRDLRFNTFDEPPRQLCVPGDTAPVINWKIYDSDDNIIHQETTSSTVMMSYQFPEDTQNDNKYGVSGKYDCGGNPNFLYESEILKFTINRGGNAIIETFEQCILDEAPYIDLNGCMSSFGKVVNMLSFGLINFDRDTWTSTDECYNLVVLHNWLHLKQSQVCPAFSPMVRNTVTPFITFFMGLIIASWITRNETDRRLW